MPNTEDLDENEVEKTPLYVQILLPIAVISFSFCYGAGFGPAIYTWSSELFPPRYRFFSLPVSHLNKCYFKAIFQQSKYIDLF